MQLTSSFESLLFNFSPVFTEPSFATFRLLMTGWILSTRHRYVTDLIISSDSVGNGHYSDYHRFFSQAVWDLDHLWRLLATLIVATLIGKDAIIYLAGDDTLCRKRGLGIFGTGMHHDPLSSSKSRKICHWGHDWVDLCIIIARPWWAPTKVFALPILMRLYRNRQGLTQGKNKSKKQRRSRQTSAASKRTAPMAMFLHSLTVVWYATEGHAEVRFPDRPWYGWKREPSFADMLTTLRRKSWEDKLSTVSVESTPDDNPLALLTYLATLAA